MSKPELIKFPIIGKQFIQKYERYLPTAFDDSLTMLEKINKVIEFMNQVGDLTNEMLEKWNEVIEWVVNNGLETTVNEKLDDMYQDGRLAQIINVEMIGSLQDLETENKENLVSAINELLNVIISNIGSLQDLETENKENLVSAINENKENLVSDINELLNVISDIENITDENTLNIGSIESLGTSPQSLSLSLSQRGYNVKDMGVKGDGVTDDTVAFQNAIDSIDDGRVLYVPPGNYIITDMLTIDKHLVLQGASAGENGRSVLKFQFSGSATGDCAIKLKEGAKATTIKDLYIRDHSTEAGVKDGISTRYNTGYVTHLQFENVWVVDFFRQFHLPSIYLCRFRDCVAVGGSRGFNLLGFSTSIVMEGCYANRNSIYGFYMGNITYSTLISCACDNSKIGYFLNELRGVKILGCGAEYNTTTGFYVVSENEGLSIDSCFGVDNGGDSGTSNYSTFIMVENENDGVELVNNIEERVEEGGNRTRSILFGQGAKGVMSNNHTVLGDSFGVGVLYNGQYIGTSIPTAGKHHQGKIVWNRNGGVGVPIGWFCTEGGTPGTWTPINL